jgi:hypothetical protein
MTEKFAVLPISIFLHGAPPCTSPNLAQNLFKCLVMGASTLCKVTEAFLRLKLT